MKKSTYHSLSVLFLCFLFLNGKLVSQTMTSTVFTQPCNNNGSIGVTVTGLTPPINYTYTNYNANISIVHTGVSTLTDVVTGLNAYSGQFFNANTWNIAAKDGSNNQAFVNVTLTPPFTQTIQILPATCPAISTIQAVGFAGGTSPYAVVWTNTATSINYPANPAQVPSGTYSMVITDGAGCKVFSIPSGTIGLQVTALSNINFNITGSPANCTNGTASVTSITGGTAPYTFLWNNSATSQNLSGLSQGNFYCIVTDNIGCQTTNYYYLSQAVTISYNSSVTFATCTQNNGAVLSFVSGGTAPYNFLWSNSATTQNLNNLTSGNYSLQITDVNGCTGYGWAYVGVNTPISVTNTVTASSCTSPTGGATITASGGTAPYATIWYTFPSTSGNSISGKAVGNYNFKVTDALGCIQTGSAFIPPTSTISAGINNNSVVCPTLLGNLTSWVSGSNPPFTYLWSNSATTNSLTNVPLGGYSCVITDAAGCSVTKYGGLSQISQVGVGVSSTPATCLFANDGSASAIAFGGTAPYTYLWSNSQTGTNATALVSANYHVVATDANGCKGGSNVFVGYNALNTGCYCTITGTVYNDLNLNCNKNALEPGLPNFNIHCSGVGYAYTDVNGVYSFKVPSGTYTLSETVPAYYPLAPCQNNAQILTITAAPGCTAVANFANTITPVHDLQITNCNNNLPVPGNTYTKRVVITNKGTLTENTAKFGYVHDGQLTYSSCSPWSLTQLNSSGFPNWYSITSGFPSLTSGASSIAYFNYNVPTNIPLSTKIVFNDTITSAAPIATNWLTDKTPWTNVSRHEAYVVGSYDPNFKEVSPQGNGPQGEITRNDSMLTYIIHFQNTGSYFAQNVVVEDTLDANLRIGSLRPGYSDHNYTVSISETGVARFTFSNIHLPWQSQYGDVLSSGMFMYTINMKKNLPIGTQIKNKAAIYFDFNEPIITNTTLNTIVEDSPHNFTGIQSINKEEGTNLIMFPNPAKDEVTILFESNENSNGILNITDISGRKVFEQTIELTKGTNYLKENTSQFQNGIYLVQIVSSSESVTKKLIINK